jgi:adenylylsulfate kinase
MKILVFGLPGSGKSTFAKQLTAETNIPHFNADEIRGMFKDWDFTENGRKRQANRMMTMCDLAVNHVVVDFVCPFESYRSFYDMKIWMNTIDKGRFEDTNKVFEKPKKVDFEIKDFNYDNIIKEIHDRLL